MDYVENSAVPCVAPCDVGDDNGGGVVDDGSGWSELKDGGDDHRDRASVVENMDGFWSKIGVFICIF